MTSAINPNNIDGAYPVAGQDNNSQGFRDNFTNTKTNFQYASDEITDLQNKAVLKSALTGTTLNNNMGGSILSGAQLQNMTQTRVLLGTLASNGTATIDYTAGPFQTFTTNGNNIIAFSNLPAAGVLSTISVQVTVATATDTVTFPTAVTVNDSGIQGLNASTNVMSFAAVGTYTFTFTSIDGGSTITINQNNNAIQPFNNSVETRANGTISLSTTTTVFTSSGNVTATLAAGQSGQIKVLAYGNTSVGNTRVTVTNAAWGSTTIANLSVVGSACTLQYANSKWICIGNNGVSFS
jgi:hypothetical protein